MRVVGVIAAIANRQRLVLVNGGVGFSTFAVGDALSQGARPPPLPMSVSQEAVTKPSWGQRFVERCVRCYGFVAESGPESTYCIRYT